VVEFDHFRKSAGLKVCKRGTWDSNPWVFAYEFELVNGNNASPTTTRQNTT